MSKQLLPVHLPVGEPLPSPCVCACQPLYEEGIILWLDKTDAMGSQSKSPSRPFFLCPVAMGRQPGAPAEPSPFGIAETEIEYSHDQRAP